MLSKANSTNITITIIAIQHQPIKNIYIMAKNKEKNAILSIIHPISMQIPFANFVTEGHSLNLQTLIPKTTNTASLQLLPTKTLLNHNQNSSHPFPNPTKIKKSNIKTNQISF
jgi:hypothetical protein